MLKDKSVEIQEEAAEYLAFIDTKRQNRQSRIKAVNDQQQGIWFQFLPFWKSAWILKTMVSQR